MCVQSIHLSLIAGSGGQGRQGSVPPGQFQNSSQGQSRAEENSNERHWEFAVG